METDCFRITQMGENWFNHRKDKQDHAHSDFTLKMKSPKDGATDTQPNYF